MRSGMRSRGGIGVRAAHDDDRAEQVLDLRGGRGVDRGLAGDHAAEEPARAVDADEAGEAHVAGLALGRRDRDLREQLGAERALAHGGRAALARDLVGDLRADLVPQAARARSGERLHLQRGVRRSRGRWRRRASCPPRPRAAGGGPRAAAPSRRRGRRRDGPGSPRTRRTGRRSARSSGADLGWSTGLSSTFSMSLTRSLLTCAPRIPWSRIPPRRAGSRGAARPRRTGPGSPA